VIDLGITVPVTVEFEDVDSYRIAHHTKLVAYLERARLRYLLARGLPVEPGACLPVMYSLELHFRRPARLMDVLDVSVAAESMDDYRVVLRYRIRRGEDVLVRARSVIAFWDPVADAPAPVPEAFRVQEGAGSAGPVEDLDL